MLARDKKGIILPAACKRQSVRGEVTFSATLPRTCSRKTASASKNSPAPTVNKRQYGDHRACLDGRELVVDVLRVPYAHKHRARLVHTALRDKIPRRLGQEEEADELDDCRDSSQAKHVSIEPITVMYVYIMR